MKRSRTRLVDDDLERKRQPISRSGPRTNDQAALIGPYASVLQLQRLAGNDAVGRLIAHGPIGVQRADAGTTTVAADPEIDALDLQADVADAARALKAKVPAVHFTSGRRSLEDDSAAVANNIVANRSYVDGFADSRPKRLIKKWVDDHPNATKQEIVDGLVTILTPMNETERSYWSLHLGGRAFDISQSSCTLADLKRVFPDALQEQTHWHVQFIGTWSKP